MLLAAPNRIGIVFGYALAAIGRWLITASVLTTVALAVGMNVGGGGVDLFGLYTLALLLNLAAVLWSAGVAMRFRTMQAGPVMQFPVFIVLFFAPVYVPLTLLQGWIHGVATVNPLTRTVGGRPRLHLRAADRGRARLRHRAHARGPLLALGPPRPAQSRSRRVDRREPAARGVVATGSPHVLAAGRKARYRAPRLASPSACHASRGARRFQ